MERVVKKKHSARRERPFPLGRGKKTQRGGRTSRGGKGLSLQKKKKGKKRLDINTPMVVPTEASFGEKRKKKKKTSQQTPS